MKDLNALWQKAKVIGKRIMNKVHSFLDSIIPSRKTQRIAFAGFALVECLLAYIIALLHIGIWHGCVSPFKMIKLYATSESSYPFGVFFLFSLLLIGCAVYLFLGSGDTDRKFNYSKSNVYGSAREISREDLETVAEVKPIEELTGTTLGKLSDTEIIGIPNNPVANRNMIVFGPPGVGKSFSIVKPQIVQAIRRGESVVCTDTKGELWGDTAELARAHGYIVKRIDLKSPAYSDGWAILKELRMDDNRALIFSEIVMKNTDNPKDPHMAAEQDLLTACCLYVERNENIPPEEKTIYQVLSLIEKGPEELDGIFEACKHDKNLRYAYNTYRHFISGSPNLRGNVVSNLCNRLKVLPSPAVTLMTSLDEIDLTLPAKKPCIYYCSMSDQHETMKFLGSLFFSFLFLDLGEYADSQLKRRCDIPVTVILEEAANIGEIYGITKALSSARSRAISITMIFQSIGQVREIYGINSTSTILTDCSIHACIGTGEQDTASIFEWESGEATVEVKTEQHEKYESPFVMSRNHSTGDGRRSVYTSNEIRKIRRGQILLGWQGFDTLLCSTFGINEHPEYIRGHMPVISPIRSIPVDNILAREFLNQKEEERVAAYNAWVQDGGNPWEGYINPKPQFDGPSRNTLPPEIIPYPELEQMALRYAEEIMERRQQERQRKQQEAQAAAQGEPKAPEEPKVPEKRNEIGESKTPPEAPPIVLPDDFVWYSDTSEPVDTSAVIMESPAFSPAPPKPRQPKKSNGAATLYAKKVERPDKT